MFDEMLRRADRRPPSIAAFNQTLASKLSPSPAAALAFFSHMPRADSHTFTVLISCCCRAARLDLGLGLFARLMKSGFHLNSVIFGSLVTALCRARLCDEAVAVVTRRMPEMGCKPDESMCNMLLKQLTSANGYRTARELLRWMGEEGKDYGCRPNVVLYSIVINGLCKEGRVDEAFEFLDDMRASQVKPDVVTYNTVLAGLSKASRTDEMFALISEMSAAGVVPSVVTYNIIINDLCESGRVAAAFDLLNKMWDVSVEPNVVTYNALLKGLCSASARERELALELLRQMSMKGTDSSRPDTVTYNTVIDGFCKAGLMDDASNLLDEMQADSVEPDVVTYNTLIDGFCKLGRMDDAFKLFGAMKIAPDVVTYSTIINGFCRVGKMDKALELVLEMRNKGAEPNVVTYSSLVDGFCKIGRLDKFREMIHEMNTNGIYPDVVTCNSFLECLCSTGKGTTALEFLKVMDEDLSKSCKPNVFSYSIVIDGLCKLGGIDEAFELFNNMKAVCVVPNVVTYSTLIDGFCRVGRIEEAAALLDDMQAFQVEPDSGTCDAIIRVLHRRAVSRTLDAFSYNAIISRYCKDGKLSKALKLLRTMQKYQVVPEVSTYRTILSGFLEKGMRVSPLEILKDMQRQFLLSLKI